ncbi:putative disease resistance protein [Morus notabilis]|uniref:Putative disease resistance protein n=1 Tax=Morus notabilis TaxID=981085 RepID=W9S0F6_9ROSA|nr:probable disease resistance protein At4g19060 [Morus notabilis]EXC02090.1 putative disease resistance protein [Morus notabilis]
MSSLFGKSSVHSKSSDKSEPKRSGSNNDKIKPDHHDVDGQDLEGDSKVPSGKASSNSDSIDVRIHWTSKPADSELPPRVHGFDNERLSLKKLLGNRENDNQFKAVGIVGTRGVGKTALCQEYYLESTFFLPRVWVSIPKQTANIGKGHHESPKIAILKRILASLGIEEEKITMNTRAKNVKPDSSSHDLDDDFILLEDLLYILRLQLIGKRYLIVLDDVRDQLSPDAWYENLDKSGTGTDPDTSGGTSLACALPKGCGGTVIVTTRFDETAKKMVGEANVLRVLPLPDPESILEIFWDAALGGDPSLSNTDVLKDKALGRIADIVHPGTSLSGNKTDITKALIREKVIIKCNGLPLAAKLMGVTMRKQLHDQNKEHIDASNQKEEPKKGDN